MDGQPLAARPIGDAGLGTLAAAFPAARPDAIRIDAVLAVTKDPKVVQAMRP
jgi:hypothetical protein